MRNIHLTPRVHALLFAVVAFATTSDLLIGDDRFTLAVGDHGDLIVTDPGGQKVGDFTAPIISQPVAISGGASFQVSFGRDMNNMMSAIISPDPAHPSDLHFSVLNKRVDSDKQAVVTLTFSASQNRVTIDPGYVGLVEVDSHPLKHHESRSATASAATPQPVSDPTTAQTSTAATPALDSAPASTPDSGASSQVSTPSPLRNVPMPPSDDASPGPSVAGGEGINPSSEVSVVEPVSTASTDTMSNAAKKRRLFWAEPVTGAGKVVPHVASDEMKLVAVHGDVTVTTPDGKTEAGANGLLVPSGSTVATASHASAAVFMGGVNSARLVPNTGIVVTQAMEGTVRHTTLDLQSGAVFSRVGKHPGESQNYEIRTPEGVAAARGTQPLDAIVHVTYNGSDHVIHAVFVKTGEIYLYIKGKLVGTITGGPGTIGMASLGTPQLTHDELEKILDGILKELQPFNVTTIQALFDYENGTASTIEIDLLEDQLFGSVPTDGSGFSPEDQAFLAGVAVPLHDLFSGTVKAAGKLGTGGGPGPDESTSSYDIRGH